MSGALFLVVAAAAPVVEKAGPLRDGSVSLPGLKAGETYSFLFSVDSLRAFGEYARAGVRLIQGAETLVRQTLHPGDADLYATFGGRKGGVAEAIWTTGRPLDAKYRLLVVKPTSSAESEGVPGAKKTPHGGGVRWEQGSAEYRAIPEWIRGAR